MKPLPDEKRTAPSYGTLLGICCGIAFASYFGSYLRIPVVPLFAVSLGASTVEVGIINSAFLLMAGVLSFPLGVLSDRVGRKPLIAWGLAISLITSLLLAFSTSPRQLMGIYLLFGMGLAAVGPTLMTYVADISPPAYAGRAYGWYTTAIYTGMSLGPAAGGLVAQGWGFRPLFLLAAGFIFLLIWVTVFFLPEVRGVREKEPKKGKRKIIGKELWKNRPLLGCWLVTLGGCFGQGMFLTFFPLHAHQQGLKMGQIGMVFAVQAIFNALSRFPIGRLSDMVGHRRNLVVLGFMGFGASLAGVGVSESMAHFTLTSIALGVTMGLAFTPLGALVAETAPPESKGLAMGGYNTCIYLGMMLSSAFMGGVIGMIGFAQTFLLTALLTFLATGLFYLMIKDFLPARLEG
jgi:MFS family permease